MSIHLDILPVTNAELEGALGKVVLGYDRLNFDQDYNIFRQIEG